MICAGCKKYFTLTKYCALCHSAIWALNPETLRRLADQKEQGLKFISTIGESREKTKDK